MDARAPSAALRQQPSGLDAAGERLTGGLGLDLDRAEGADQRLVPDAGRRGQYIFPEDRKQHRSCGRSPDGAATQLVVHRTEVRTP